MTEQERKTFTHSFAGEDPVVPKEILATGQEPERFHIVTCFIGPYEVVIRLTDDGKFVEVLQVGVNKDFRDYVQRISTSGHHDVEKFYEE